MLKEKERCSKLDRYQSKDKKHRYYDDNYRYDKQCAGNSIYDSKCMHNSTNRCIHLNAKCIESSSINNYNYIDFDYGASYYYMNHVNSDRGSVTQA
jgi:hypothetical protein